MADIRRVNLGAIVMHVTLGAVYSCQRRLKARKSGPKSVNINQEQRDGAVNSSTDTIRHIYATTYNMQV